MRTRNVCVLVAMGSAMAATAALGVRGERDASAAPPAQAARRAAETGPGASEMCPITQPAKLRMILRELHAVNQREIDAAKLAEARASSPQVKGFASEMLRDHQAADEKLQDLARKRHLNLAEATPNDPIHAAADAALDARVAMLKDEQGAAFDAAYLGPQPLVHALALQAIDRGLKLAPPKGPEHDLLGDLKGSVTMHREHALRLESQLVLPPLGIGGGASGPREPVPEHDHGPAGAEPQKPSTGGGPSESEQEATKDAGATGAGDAQAFPPERTAPAPDHEQEPGVEDHVEGPEE